MVKVTPSSALETDQEPSKPTLQPSSSHVDQTEHIISNLKVDQTLPVIDTTESIATTTAHPHTHQQRNTSQTTKKITSERFRLQDTWNTPELVEEFLGRRRRRSAAQQVSQAIQHHVQGQALEQTESIATEPATHVNEPTTSSDNTMVARDMTPTPSIAESSSAPRKRKTRDANFNDTLNASDPQTAEKKVAVVEARDSHDDEDDVFQPTPLLPPPSQPKAEATSKQKTTGTAKVTTKATLKPKQDARSKTATKPKTPRKKAEAKPTTPRKKKAPVALTPPVAQSTIVSRNLMAATPSNADLYINHRASFHHVNPRGLPYTSSQLPNASVPPAHNTIYAQMQSTDSSPMQSPVYTCAQVSENLYIHSPDDAYAQSPAKQSPGNTQMRSFVNPHVHSPMSTQMQQPANAQYHGYPRYNPNSFTPGYGSPSHFNNSSSFEQNQVYANQAPSFSYQMQTPSAVIRMDPGTNTGTSDILPYNNYTEQLMYQATLPEQQQPSTATPPVKSPRKRTTTPKSKGQQPKVARNTKSPKSEPAVAPPPPPVVDAADTDIISSLPSMEDADPVSISSRTPHTDSPVSVAHDQATHVHKEEKETIDTNTEETIDIMAEETISVATPLVATETATNKTSKPAKKQAKTAKAQSTVKRSRKQKASSAKSNATEGSSSTNVDATDPVLVGETDTAPVTKKTRKAPAKPRKPKSMAIDTPMVDATGNNAEPLSSSSQGANLVPASEAHQAPLSATTIKETQNETVATTELKADTLLQPESASLKADTPKMEAMDTLVKDVNNHVATLRADLPETSTSSTAKNVVKSEANDLAQETVNLAENEAAATTSKGKGKSKKTASSATRKSGTAKALKETKKAKESKEPKKPKALKVPKELEAPKEPEALQAGVIDVTMTEAIGKDSVPAQDTTPVVESEIAAGTGKATGKFTAKSSTKQKAATTTKAPSKKKTSTATKAPSKRKRTPKKKVAEPVEQQDVDIQVTSNVVNVTDEGETIKKRKVQQPESSTTATHRQSTRPKKKPKYADDGDDDFMMDAPAAAEEDQAQLQSQEEEEEEEEEQYQDSAHIQLFLENRDSFLVEQDLKVLLPQLLSGLPVDVQAELAKLLPPPDLEGASAGNPIPLAFFSPSNTHFYEAASKYQEVLGIGGFEPETIKKREAMRAAEKQDDSFKDDNYEAYWGERLERDKKQKAADKAKEERAARGRGGRGAAGSRDKGKAKAV